MCPTKWKCIIRGWIFLEKKILIYSWKIHVLISQNTFAKLLKLLFNKTVIKIKTDKDCVTKNVLKYNLCKIASTVI